MRSRSAILIVILCGVAGNLLALPKVAVLDAVLPDKMDEQIAIGVTEKISEELVVSGKYTVLDRTTVGQSLKEIEFQMSGLVSDADIKKAGEQLNTRLGATFVVIARVSEVAGTYFVSAKLIDIKTGEINAQASYEAEGGPAVTFTIAQVVGKKLAVGAKESTQVAESAPSAAEKTAAAPEPAPAPEPVATEPPPEEEIVVPGQEQIVSPGQEQIATQEEIVQEQPRFKSHLTVAYVLPVTIAGGFDVHWLQHLFGGLFFTVGVAEIDNVNTTFDGQLGIGWGFPIGQSFQLYAGANIGYMFTTFGSSGLCYGADLGCDLILFGFLDLGARVSYTMAEISGGLFGGSVDYLGISIAAGFAY